MADRPSVPNPEPELAPRSPWYRTMAEWDAMAATLSTVCGESPTGVEDCTDPIAHYVEWTEGGIMGAAATLCEKHTADLRAGRDPYHRDDGWSVHVTFVRDIDSHHALCRAKARELLELAAVEHPMRGATNDA